MTSFDDEHTEWDALAVGWALSALDAADEDRFAGHLPDCARCTATVRESLYTVSDLAYGMPEAEPPASLKIGLMAAVRAEPRRPADAPAAEPEWPMSEPHPGAPGYSADWFDRPDARDDSYAPPDDRPYAQPGDRSYGAPGDRSSGAPGDGSYGQPGDRPYGAPGDHAFGTPGDAPSGPSGHRSFGTPGEHLPAQPGDPRFGAPADRPFGAAPRAPYGEFPPDEIGDAPYGASAVGELADGGRIAAPGQHYLGGAADRPAGARRGRYAVADDGDDGTVIAFEPRRRNRGSRFTVAAAAAAVIALIAGLTVWNVQLRNDRDQLTQVVAQREAAISQLTANGPARIAALTSNGQPSPTRKATLVVRGNRVEVLIEGLPTSVPNERYWLWTLRCDTPKPTDLKPIRGFQVTQRDFSVRDIGSDPGLASATCFAISSEVGTATPKAPREVVAVGKPN